MTIIELNAGAQLTNTIAKIVSTQISKLNKNVDLAVAFEIEKLPDKTNEYIIKMGVYNNSDKMEYNIDILTQSQQKVVNQFFVPSKHLYEIEFAYVTKFISGEVFITTINREIDLQEKETFIFAVDNKQFDVEIDLGEIIRLSRQ